jgi:hypothetical protein
MKTPNKVKKLVYDLNELMPTVEIIESEVGHVIRRDLKKRVEGAIRLKLKTVFDHKTLYLKVFLYINNRSRLKNVIVPYNKSMAENIVEQINVQLGK